MNRDRSKRRRRRLTRVLIAVLALVLLDYVLYPRLARMGGRSGNTGENGLWLRYTWYFGEHTAAETRDLARLFVTHEIRDAYFHVRFIQSDGTLHFRKLDGARSLIEVMHREAPGVRVIAWIYAGNSRGDGAVDISSTAVRANMVSEAQWLIEECGFDGIQWDHEVCLSGDPHLISLLRETRSALPNTFVSVCAPVWAPRALTGRWGWTDDYFAEVAAECDQIAVMGYDTGIYTPRAYVWLMRQQVMHVTGAVGGGNPDCRVIIGVPTYGASFPAHHPYAESLRMGLKGVREGLADPAADPSVLAGVALFAHYTTEADEWETYRDLWLDH